MVALRWRLRISYAAVFGMASNVTVGGCSLTLEKTYYVTPADGATPEGGNADGDRGDGWVEHDAYDAVDEPAAVDAVGSRDVITDGSIGPVGLDAGTPTDVVTDGSIGPIGLDAGAPSDATDGSACAANLGNDPLNCGACGNVCPIGSHATPTCTGGACGLLCDPFYANCDAQPANGCEADLHAPATCGTCLQNCTVLGASCGADAMCCGGSGNPCCASGAAHACGSGLACAAGLCSCGGAGEPCCAGSHCGGGTLCGAGYCLDNGLGMGRWTRPGNLCGSVPVGGMCMDGSTCVDLGGLLGTYCLYVPS